MYSTRHQARVYRSSMPSGTLLLRHVPCFGLQLWRLGDRDVLARFAQVQQGCGF